MGTGRAPSDHLGRVGACVNARTRWDASIRGADVVITGGSGGIGSAIAQALIPLECRMHLVARSVAPLEAAAAALRAAGAQSVHTYACDCTDEHNVQQLAATLGESGVRPRLLVTAAGSTRPGRFDELPAGTFDDLMRDNYLSTVYTVRALLPLMSRDTHQRYLLLVGSVASVIGVYGMTAYSAAKFAVRGLTMALRQELAPQGITVSLLCPPDTRTPMLANELPLRPPETEALSPANEAIAPERVARAAIRGLRQGRAEIFPGYTAWLPALLQRFIPALLARHMASTIAQSAGGGRR